MKMKMNLSTLVMFAASLHNVQGHVSPLNVHPDATINIDLTNFRNGVDVIILKKNTFTNTFEPIGQPFTKVGRDMFTAQVEDLGTPNKYRVTLKDKHVELLTRLELCDSTMYRSTYGGGPMYCPDKRLFVDVDIDLAKYKAGVDVVISAKQRDANGVVLTDNDGKAAFKAIRTLYNIGKTSEPTIKKRVLDVGPGNYRLTVIDKAAELIVPLQDCATGYCPTKDLSRIIRVDMTNFKDSVDAEISVRVADGSFQKFRTLKDIGGREVTARVLFLPQGRYRVTLVDKAASLVKTLANCPTSGTSGADTDLCLKGDVTVDIYIETGYEDYALLPRNNWDGYYPVKMDAQLLVYNEASGEYDVFRTKKNIGGNKQKRILTTVLALNKNEYIVRFLHNRIADGGVFESELMKCDDFVYCPMQYPKKCTKCDDTVTQWMIDNEGAMADSRCSEGFFTAWHAANRCTVYPSWVTNGSCRESCYLAGRGYDDDVCCGKLAE